ncbi:MAG: hypothetical protein U0835_20675 [Isosphaeraceae bacterium]
MKRIFRYGWNATAPVRRPILRKIEGFITRCVARAIEAQRAEVDLVLDALLTEQFRLQARVEELQRMLMEERGAGRAAG